MTETQAFVVIRLELIKQLAAYGYTPSVLAGRQPSKALLRDNSVYLFPIGEARQGVQGRSYKPVGNNAGHIERVRVSKTIQVQCFKKTDIKDASAPTATDLCAIVKMIIDSLPFQEAIRAKGIAAHNSVPIREPEFINDAGDYEKNPSFDFDMSFTREIRPITPAIEAVTAVTHGI
jgi:hypothetical protein